VSFEYGQSSLGINNPFKVEGKISAVSGILICITGLYVLLGVSSDLKVNHLLGWKDAIFGLVILLWGISVLAISVLKISRFYVGRNAPASLAKNENPSENYKEFCSYKKIDLESMFTSRKNITFMEPNNLVQRVLYSVLPSLLFTPPPVSYFLYTLSDAFKKLLVGFFVYVVLYFISTVGLLGDMGFKLTSALSFGLLAYFVIILIDVAGITDLSVVRNAKKVITGGLIAIFGLVFFQTIFSANEMSVEPVSFNAWFPMIIFLIFSGATVAFVILLINQRGYGSTKTEVSEYRDNMQESIHPNDVMIHLEQIILANRRYKELPNRIYQKFEPVLQGENNTKGSFNGKAMIETQPAFVETEYNGKFKQSRLVATVSAQVLITISAFLFAWLSGRIATVSDIGTFTGTYTILFVALIIFSSGTILQKFAHIMWSELRFKSLLLWMKMEGTFSESKVSTGMSVYDSTRSENTLVRSSITNWIICSSITTSTFAEAGTDNVEGYRYILEMEKDDREMEAVIGELKNFLSSRQNIAKISAFDVENADDINDLNKKSGIYQTGYLKIEGVQPSSVIQNSGLLEQ
jgi:hypothetical protein